MFGVRSAPFVNFDFGNGAGGIPYYPIQLRPARQSPLLGHIGELPSACSARSEFPPNLCVLMRKLPIWRATSIRA